MTLGIWSIPALPVIVDLAILAVAVAVIGRRVRWENSAVLVGALATAFGAAINTHNGGRTVADIVGNAIFGAAATAAVWALAIRFSRRRGSASPAP